MLREETQEADGSEDHRAPEHPRAADPRTLYPM